MSLQTAQTILMLPVLFFSIMCHEVAHAWVAWKGGDDTARLKGRISMNPLVHVDPLGSIILPLALLLTQTGFVFGWAKPVPVNTTRLRSRHWDVAVSLAGVTVNFLLAFLAAGALRLFLAINGAQTLVAQDGVLTLTWCVMQILQSFIMINLVLMVFNLLPIPPLDGSHVLLYFAGTRNSAAFQAFAFLERFGFIILVALMATGVLWKILGPAIQGLMALLMWIFRF